MTNQAAPKAGVPDPEAWAAANHDLLRYAGCRICDLGTEWRDNLNVLYDKGFRRVSLSQYLQSGGIDYTLTDNDMNKHFRGGREHGRP